MKKKEIDFIYKMNTFKTLYILALALMITSQGNGNNGSNCGPNGNC